VPDGGERNRSQQERSQEIGGDEQGAPAEAIHPDPGDETEQENGDCAGAIQNAHLQGCDAQHQHGSKG
jgi:hypothetical protein